MEATRKMRVLHGPNKLIHWVPFMEFERTRARQSEASQALGGRGALNRGDGDWSPDLPLVGQGGPAKLLCRGESRARALDGAGNGRAGLYPGLTLFAIHLIGA